MARIGYARVSTKDQNTEMQMAELREAGCERIFEDHGISGTTTERPELDAMLQHLRNGDEVVVWKLDRLGRNTRHLLELLDGFKDKGYKFTSLRDGISTDPSNEVGSAMAKAMITIMSAFAQLERDQLSERTKAGMAKDSAGKAGRVEVTAESNIVKRAKELRTAGMSIAELQKQLAPNEGKNKGRPVSRATVYRYLGM
ncbi:recombinase family protein [Glutamicibacter ardleyensis]|uniref:recombinase family protein n=1 Tax=Glutamicibacter ardleyensis TaxID=225894 RepID=UPI003FCFCC6A